MNSKPKSIDMGSLIKKVTKRARELLKKKSKPQNKGKSANGTSRYSKSKRQKLLIGGVKVKLDSGVKQDILNVIGVKTQQRTAGQAHLVELLKLKTIQKIQSGMLEYLKSLQNAPGRVDLTLTQEEANKVRIIEDTLKNVGPNLKLSSTVEIDSFKLRQQNLEKFINSDDSVSQDIKDFERETYNYDLFIDSKNNYEECKIEKEITVLNIFKLFYNLTNMEEEQRGGGIFDQLQLSVDEQGNPSGGPIENVKVGDQINVRIAAYQSMFQESKDTIKKIREDFEKAGLVKKLDKKGSTAIPGMEGVERAPMTENNDLLGNNYQQIISQEEDRKKFRKLLEDIQNGGKYNKINFKGRAEGRDTEGNKIKKVDAYTWNAKDPDIFFYIYTIEYNKGSSSFEVILRVLDDSNHEQMNILKNEIKSINEILQEIINSYRNNENNEALYEKITKTIELIYYNYGLLSAKHKEYKPDSWMNKNPQNFLIINSSLTGGNPVKYKSTGQVVHIMFQNKKYKRVIYVKDKRNTKYCKMNNEYILLSKLKVIE